MDHETRQEGRKTKDTERSREKQIETSGPFSFSSPQWTAATDPSRGRAGKAGAPGCWGTGGAQAAAHTMWPVICSQSCPLFLPAFIYLFSLLLNRMG